MNYITRLSDYEFNVTMIHARGLAISHYPVDECLIGNDSSVTASLSAENYGAETRACFDGPHARAQPPVQFLNCLVIYPPLRDQLALVIQMQFWRHPKQFLNIPFVGHWALGYSNFIRTYAKE